MPYGLMTQCARPVTALWAGCELMIMRAFLLALDQFDPDFPAKRVSGHWIRAGWLKQTGEIECVVPHLPEVVARLDATLPVSG